MSKSAEKIITLMIDHKKKAKECKFLIKIKSEMEIID